MFRQRLRKLTASRPVLAAQWSTRSTDHCQEEQGQDEPKKQATVRLFSLSWTFFAHGLGSVHDASSLPAAIGSAFVLSLVPWT